MLLNKDLDLRAKREVDNSRQHLWKNANIRRSAQQIDARLLFIDVFVLLWTYVITTGL